MIVHDKGPVAHDSGPSVHVNMHLRVLQFADHSMTILKTTTIRLVNHCCSSVMSITTIMKVAPQSTHAERVTGLVFLIISGMLLIVTGIVVARSLSSPPPQYEKVCDEDPVHDDPVPEYYFSDKNLTTPLQ